LAERGHDLESGRLVDDRIKSHEDQRQPQRT
jgi:hypothetical protein